MNDFTIRFATKNDFPTMLEIYKQARTFMKENGNESQWGLPSPGKTLWPSEESINNKMENNLQYICETTVNGKTEIAATFAFTNGIPESAYSSIYEGNWPDDGTAPYGVIHCFASAGIVKGAAKFCLEWALEQCGYLKIDTHPNNKPMRSLLEKEGFTYCGKILMPEVQNDDIVRVAYFKAIRAFASS